MDGGIGYMPAALLQGAGFFIWYECAALLIDTRERKINRIIRDFMHRGVVTSAESI